MKTATTVKISRRAVRTTVLLCNIAQHSNRTVTFLFDAASRGLPLGIARRFLPATRGPACVRPT